MTDSAQTTSKLDIIGPVVDFAKMLWQLCDVGTIMIRMLYNTFAHDNPIGAEVALGESPNR